ncbi:hypothetical protein TRICI_003934 [Trichomonascus ciferrii]|uniref:PRISE-like Rossmann-fold domain-containing protein n=1 Tax=Trichomonascus ciferrii TaxID=44093 RepID=A0A642V1Y6_9ASCO|nr:hypothetical protein TRICI_003934 [Trichomonascus ciferrii]
MSTAIVTGATGITGSAVVQELLKDDSYIKLYTFSRRNQGNLNPKVQHASLDLQNDAKEMAESLKGVSADYVFFCAYLEKSDPDEATEINGKMLSNFIEALTQTGATKQLKRFILTCGFKQHGVHLGPVKQPSEESDPLITNDITGGSWPSNFYYKQEQILVDASRNRHWEWVCTLPEDVLGYAKGNFMNEATALGIYCSVCKALPGSELPFPGNRLSYLALNTWTSARLHAKFCLWAAKAPNAGNNIFNVTNGDTQSFQNLWPKLAKRFGCKVPDPMFPDNIDLNTDTKGYKQYEPSLVHLKNKSPMIVHAKDMGLSNDPLVQNEPVLNLQIDPIKWAQRDDVKKTWEILRDKYNLDQDVWEKATWAFLSFVLGRSWNCVGNMNKARKLGWTGYADTWDDIEEILQTLEKEHMIPPAEKLRADF